MKKIIISILLLNFLVLVPLGQVSASTFENDYTSDEASDVVFWEVVDAIDSIIEQNIIINSSGIIVEEPSKIIYELDKLDLASIQGVLGYDGIQNALNSEMLLNTYLQYIEEINYEISNDSLVVLEHGTIVEADESFSLQANVNRDTTHWWGRRRLKSRVNANRWAANIRSASHAIAAAGIGLAIFGGVAGIPNGLTAVYGYNLADRIDYHNGRTNRGIQADLHWTLTFRIQPQ